jgi:hypothetical protein
MKFKIVQPHPNFPLAYVHIRVSTQTPWGEKQSGQLESALKNRRISVIGRWEVINDLNGDNMRIPVLLEDEHVKPAKRKKR